MILKTYTRILTTDLESTAATLMAVHGTEPHFMLDYDPWTLVGIGDVLVVGGTEETLEPIRESLGPWIVQDIDGPGGSRDAARPPFIAHSAKTGGSPPEWQTCLDFIWQCHLLDCLPGLPDQGPSTTKFAAPPARRGTR